jgi:hypothetical protein
VSFFDDEPTRVSSAPRRPAEPRRPATPADETPPGDRQTLRTRQAIAIGVGVILLLIIIFGVKGCLDSASESSLKDYNRNVSAIVADSNDQVMAPFFKLLSGGTAGAAAGDLQVQINQIRLAAEEDGKRANELDIPGEMRDAQQNLMLTLDLRSGALTKIAELLPKAQGTGQAAETATNEIAGQMQSFLASDVVYSQRTAPLIKQALDSAGITGQTIEPSQSLPGYTWLAPSTVAAAIGGQAGAGTTDGAVAPGLHGHAITSTTIAGTELQPSPAANKVTATPPVAVTVKLLNGGESDEKNVTVTVTLTAPGAEPITAKKVVNLTAAGSETDVAIALPSAPASGTAATLTVKVDPVPGETGTDNNEATYTVLFAGG